MSSQKKLGLLVPGKGNNHISARKQSRKKSLKKSALFLEVECDTSQSDDSASSSSEESEERDTKETKRKERDKKAHIPVVNN